MPPDDTQRRGLIADLSRRLALAPLDDLRVLDKLEQRLAQLRFVWTRRSPTSPHDIDTRYHLAATIGDSEVTRCNGRWPSADPARIAVSPPVLERCMACQRAAWSDSASELDPLISAVLEMIAAEDLARANLRDAARAEMLGEPEAYVELGGESG